MVTLPSTTCRSCSLIWFDDDDDDNIDDSDDIDDYEDDRIHQSFSDKDTM